MSGYYFVDDYLPVRQKQRGDFLDNSARVSYLGRTPNGNHFDTVTIRNYNHNSIDAGFESGAG